MCSNLPLSVVLYCPWCCDTAIPLTLVSYTCTCSAQRYCLTNSLSLSLSTLFVTFIHLLICMFVFSFHSFSTSPPGNTSSFPLLHLTCWTTARKILCVSAWGVGLTYCAGYPYAFPSVFGRGWSTSCQCGFH